jgi:hypothetical protein
MGQEIQVVTPWQIHLLACFETTQINSFDCPIMSAARIEELSRLAEVIVSWWSDARVASQRQRRCRLMERSFGDTTHNYTRWQISTAETESKHHKGEYPYNATAPSGKESPRQCIERGWRCQFTGSWRTTTGWGGCRKRHWSSRLSLTVGRLSDL